MKTLKPYLAVLTLIVFYLLGSSPVWASVAPDHGRQDSVRNAQMLQQAGAHQPGPPPPPPGQPVPPDQIPQNENAVPPSSTGITASLSDFPSLHPLVVHFPIVLLILAFFSQLAGLFVSKKTLSWVTMLLLFGGFIGALIAAELVHPHVHDLTEHARQVLHRHDLFATITEWLSGIGLVLKVISHFFLRLQLWMEIVVLAVLLGTAVSVSLAGHEGAQLAYIEGVGPQGHYLRTSGPDND